MRAVPSLVFLALAVAFVTLRPSTAAPTPQQWEYLRGRVVIGARGLGVDDGDPSIVRWDGRPTTQQLNDLGKLGWELCLCDNTGVFHFRRPKP
ncbi:MAG: hypothetical protein IT460_10885 [Planctomycetes bacterium]|nr:hypothetical protein [Planctomycetota bacterium]